MPVDICRPFSHPREMRWSLPSAAGPQSWYQVALLLTSPVGGWGQGSHRYTLSLCPGEEALAHHVRRLVVLCMWPQMNSTRAPRLWCELPVWITNSSQQHRLGKLMHFFFCPLDGLRFRDYLIPLIPLKKYHIIIILAKINIPLLLFCYNSPVERITASWERRLFIGNCRLWLA